MTHEDWPLPRPADSAIFRTLPEGAVLFSTTSEVYFGVNAVGARIWSLLPPASHSFSELCATLSAENAGVDEARIREDAREFIERLTSSGLAIASPAAEPFSDAPHS